mgnify:CR=1 FL=1
MVDVYGLIGKSIQHSLSPTIYNSLFNRYGIDADYRLYELDKLEPIMEKTQIGSIKGLNVTKPYKIEILNNLKNLSKEAEKIGSVNTIVREEDKLIGHNTDGIGARNALNRFIALNDKNVLQLGAGGAGRAVAYELSKWSNVVVLNRKKQKAKELEKFSIKGLKLNNKNLKDYTEWCDILINTTSVGMNSNKSLVNSRLLNEDILVFDIVYSPMETRLLSEAREVGCKSVDGLWMLIYQALACFKLWTGITPDADFIRKKTMEVLK